MAAFTSSQEFTTPGAVTFTGSAGVTNLLITMIGGGGSGGGMTGGFNFDGAAGGGAGEWCRRVPLKIADGGTVTGTVGAKGAGYTGTGKGNDGTATTFGPYIALPGFGGQRNDGGTNGTTGGGYGAPRPDGTNFNNTPGDMSTYEYSGWNAGASGGGKTSNSTVNGDNGGPCEGHLGGIGGPRTTVSSAFRGGGAGGGASPWGDGANGGDGSSNGSNATAGAYGTGGGGSGNQGTSSGAGMDGYILVEWQSP